MPEALNPSDEMRPPQEAGLQNPKSDRYRPPLCGRRAVASSACQLSAPGGPSANDSAIRTVFVESDELLELSRDLAADGTTMLYQGRPQGGSMRPFVRSGDRIIVERVGEESIRLKDILVFCHARGNLVAHRLIRIENVDGRRRYVTRGDAFRQADPPCAYDDIVGKAVRILRGDMEIPLDGWWHRRRVDLWLLIRPALLFGRAAWRRIRRDP
jgi:signal peptidase I